MLILFVRRETDEDAEDNVQLNEMAVKMMERISAKLKGRDFAKSPTAAPLDVAEQVDKLIQQATCNGNLCQSWVGWCPYW